MMLSAMIASSVRASWGDGSGTAPPGVATPSFFFTNQPAARDNDASPRGPDQHLTGRARNG
jgi:hypothetical protein